jgi:hypothetical protein
MPNRPGPGNDAFNLNHRSYIEINGFELTAGPQSQGVTAGWGGAPGHIRVINNFIHDCGGSGIQLNHADYVDVEGNTVYHNALLAPWFGSGRSIYQPVAADAEPGFHIIIRNNLVFLNDNAVGGTDGNGIILDDFRHTQDRGVPYTQLSVVENNLSVANGGAGIQVYYSDNVVVRNNTTYFNRQRSSLSIWRGELSNVNGTNNIWVNNIAWTDPKADSANTAIVDVGKVNGRVTWANNLTFDGLTGSRSVRIDHGASSLQPANGNLLGVDPRFVARDTRVSGDFHLAQYSPAIGRGTAKYGVPQNDLDGRLRNSQSVDIGAYSFNSSR